MSCNDFRDVQKYKYLRKHDDGTGPEPNASANDKQVWVTVPILTRAPGFFSPFLSLSPGPLTV